MQKNSHQQNTADYNYKAIAYGRYLFFGIACTVNEPPVNCIRYFPGGYRNHKACGCYNKVIVSQFRSS